MSTAHDHDHGRHDPQGHGHSHANEHDQGLRGMLRYARFARRMWRSEVNDAAVELVAPMPREVVADLGAGVGAGTVVAARRGAIVRAVEPTPYMRRVLQLRRLAQRHRRNIEIVDGTAEATNLDDASVDAIWAVNTMHHWTDMELAADELVRVLRPGGRIVLVDEDFEDPAHPDHERHADRHQGGHALDMIDPDAVRALLEGAGLSVSASGARRIADRPSLVIEASKPAGEPAGS